VGSESRRASFAFSERSDLTTQSSPLSQHHLIHSLHHMCVPGEVLYTVRVLANTYDYCMTDATPEVSFQTGTIQYRYYNIFHPEVRTELCLFRLLRFSETVAYRFALVSASSLLRSSSSSRTRPLATLRGKTSPLISLQVLKPTERHDATAAPDWRAE
jgi:hypothetical protein